jgi:glyoxylase-like metal-dependent hydrolase (beta-lactamase superfamily II)
LVLAVRRGLSLGAHLMSIPLEDLFNDVVGKSQRGLGFAVDALAEKAGVTVAQVEAVKDGAPDHATLLKLAPALGLHGPSLVTMADGGWTPAEVALEGLAQFNTTYHDMTVNAYLVWDAQTREAAAFDTGATAAPMVERIHELGLTLKYLFLTHTHPDHVADIPALAAPTVLVSEREPHPAAQTFAPGTTWQLGGLSIESRSTWGHSKGGTTFVVRGLAQPVAIVGDALFASSMGGGAVSFPDALATNRREIFTLPDETVIAPGHGPLTTVGEEKARNPFYPEFK